MKNNLVSIIIKPCPQCGGRRFLYHSPQERQTYKGKVVVGKYGCVFCNWQTNLEGKFDE